MAEQCNGSLVTPEKDRFGGIKIGQNAARIPSLNSGCITRSLSFGSYDNGETAIRNSGEKLNSPNAGNDTIPHYLRASTGSCHDICKYGRRRAFEEKAMIPLRKRSAKSSLNELYSKEKHDEPSEETDKHSLIVKPSPDAKSFSPKSLDARTLSRRLNASFTCKTRSPNSTTEKSTSLETPDIIKRELSYSVDDNKMAIAYKETFDQSMKNSSSLRSKRVGVPTGGKMRTHLFPKAKRSTSVKLLSPGKDRNRMDRVESENYPLESVPDNLGIPASLARASSVLLSHEEEDEEIKYSGTETDEFASDNTTSIEIGNLKPVKENQDILALAKPSSPVSLSNVDPSSMFRVEEDQGIKHSGNDAEIDMLQPTKENNKTLGMATVPALPSSKPLSRSKAGKRVSGNTVTVMISKAKPLKGNHNKNLGKDEVVSCGDKHRRPVKSKFISGKMVNIRQDDNRVPIRLKFKKRRVSDPKADGSVSESERSMEIGNVRFLKKSNRTLRKTRSEVKSRSPGRLIKGEKGANLQPDNIFPKRLKFRRPKNLGIEDGKCDSKTTSKNTDILSGKINLKHQDVKGKNHGQCSFNNVIKETASKLVESRKSKVKALVGAFETVISLQEGKPSPHIAN